MEEDWKEEIWGDRLWEGENWDGENFADRKLEPAMQMYLRALHLCSPPCWSCGSLEKTAKELTVYTSFQTLERIRDIVDDDSLDDPECFQRVERIIRALEDAGIGGGERHDY